MGERYPRNELLELLEQTQVAVETFMGIRQQFEDAGWTRDQASQMVVDLYHQSVNGVASAPEDE